MKKLRLVCLLLGAFIGGVAFVVACGDDTMKIIDAGSDAKAAECGLCEPSIDPTRIYRTYGVLDARDPILISRAACEPGDVLLGGGCWPLSITATEIYDTAGNGLPPLMHGPVPPLAGEPGDLNEYECVVDRSIVGDATLMATAICLRLVPPQ